MPVSRVLISILACTIPIAILATFIVPAMFLFNEAFAILLLGIIWSINISLGLSVAHVQSYERGKARPLMVVGMIACAAALVMWTVMFWHMHTAAAARATQADIPRWMPGAAALFTSTAVFAALAAISLRMPLLDAAAIWLRRAVIAVALVAAIHATTATFVFPFLELRTHYGIDDYVFRHLRWGGIYFMLITCGMLGFAGTYHLRKLIGGKDAVVVRVPVTVTCPRCGRSQRMQTEGDSCSQCGLRIKVSVP